MPDMIPVGNTIIPPDPMRGVNTLSGIIGIQQQKQQLQTGAYQQQAVQAGAEQSQQENREKQALAQFTSNAVQDPSFLDSNGQPDVQKFQAGAMHVAPVYGQQYIGQMTSNFNSGIANRRAMLSLSNEQRTTAGNYFGALAAKPDANEDDLRSTIDQARGVSSDPNYQHAIDDFLRHMPPTAGLATGQASTAIRQAARQAAVATQAPTAAQSNPNLASVQLPKNVLGLMETNPQAIGGAGAIKGGVIGGVAPEQQPGYLAQAAGASATGSASAQNDEALYNQITQGAAHVGQIKSLTGEVQQLAQEVKTGKYSKEGATLWAAIAQRVPGFDSSNLTEATRRQLLGKYTQQLMLQADQANGASTDAAQAHVNAAMPDPDHMTPDALVDSARFVGGQADLAKARAQLAMKHRGIQGNSQGLRGIDTMFMSQADPRDFVYKGLPAGDERKQYLRDHPDFKNQLLMKSLQQ